VHNLHTDPVGCMIVSAFFPTQALSAWPVLIALAVFGANRVLGSWRALVVCAAGHVIGTLVSEGIVGYRVSHGTLGPASRYIIDVGPSYVVVAAIAVAVLYGGWVARIAALADLLVLVFVGGIFNGLGGLDVAPVGHATSITVGAITGSAAVWQLRRRQARRAGAPAAVPAAQAAADDPRPADKAAQPRPPA
jgi:hypothetical protein